MRLFCRKQASNQCPCSCLCPCPCPFQQANVRTQRTQCSSASVGQAWLGLAQARPNQYSTMHTASYKFLMKDEESVECHQTIYMWVHVRWVLPVRCNSQTLPRVYLTMSCTDAVFRMSHLILHTKYFKKGLKFFVGHRPRPVGRHM